MACTLHLPDSQWEDSCACWQLWSSDKVYPHVWTPQRAGWTSLSLLAFLDEPADPRQDLLKSKLLKEIYTFFTKVRYLIFGYTLARKVPVMKISISMVMTSWTMRSTMAAGHSSVMQRKPYPMVVWDSREKRKAPVRVCICITQGVWLDGGSNSRERETFITWCILYLFTLFSELYIFLNFRVIYQLLNWCKLELGLWLLISSWLCVNCLTKSWQLVNDNNR